MTRITNRISFRGKYLATGAIVVAILLGAAVFLSIGRSEETVRWTAINVAGRAHSGDAHLIEYPDGSRFLVDTGFELYADRYLLPELHRRGVGRLDGVLITHAHRNHYGALLRLAGRIPIEVVYFNDVDEKVCNAETWSGGCQYEHVQQVRRSLVDQGIEVRTAFPGDLLYADESRGIFHRVLFAFNGVNTPVGRTDVNDTSVISRLEFGNQSILFCGDLNTRIGRYLVDSGQVPRSTVMTAPHHGVDSAAPNRFLDLVEPQLAVATVNGSTWAGERGKRMRTWFARHGVPVFVSGVHGHIMVTLHRDSFEVSTSNEYE